MEISQEKMIFLDTIVSTREIEPNKVILTTDVYSKSTDTHQYLNPTSCHPKNQVDNIPIGVAERLRRNCSDNVDNDATFKSRLVEYKAYLMKSGHSSDNIDKLFCQKSLVKRSETLKRKDKIQPRKEKRYFVTEFEPSFPDIKAVWRKYDHILKNDPELKEIFPNGVKNFQLVYKRGGKNIKELIASPTINKFDSSNETIQSGCFSCGKNCIDCKYLENKGQFFQSTTTKRRHKVRQRVDCLTKNVIYLITCRKCKLQGVGETRDFKKRMANYRSSIKNKKISCNIDKHFVENLDHSLNDFDSQIICQIENVPRNQKQLTTRLKQFEGYWQIQLCTLLPYGMNSINELEANLKWSDKNVFYPKQDRNG